MYKRHFTGPHRKHTVNRCGLLLQLSHAAVCVCALNCGKTAERSRCRLGCRLVCSQRNRLLSGGLDPSGGRGTFEGNPYRPIVKYRDYTAWTYKCKHPSAAASACGERVHSPLHAAFAKLLRTCIYRCAEKS